MRFSGLAVLALAASMSRAQDVPSSVKEALAAAKASVEVICKIPAKSRTFDNTIGALDDLNTRLETATSIPIFLQNVSTSAKERDDARAAEEAVAAFGIELSTREDLYKAVKEYADTHPILQGEQKRLLEFLVRDYHRAGMDLPKDRRDRLNEIDLEIQKTSQTFEKNVAEDETCVWLTPSELKGVPSAFLSELTTANGLVKVTMDGPTFGTVLDSAESGITRQKVWTAYKRRGGKKNIALLEKILKLRAEEAKILGYANYVDYAAETRMAKNAANIKKFYDELRPIVRKKAAADYAEFLAEKKSFTRDSKAVLYPWDQSFLKARLMKKKYQIDEEKVAEYFPVDRVFSGLFEVASNLYGIEFKDVTANASALGLPTWHADAKLFAVTDKATKSLIGHIYTDLHPRENKYTHAACWGLRPRKVWADGSVQLPLAALVCNFTKPTKDKPSLMAHSEVETFFHEFGHGLHNLLTETRYGRFSGANTAIDFVEAPSQMFENWTWEPAVLKLFARHYKTGEALPESMLKNMKAAQTLASGLETEHQLYYGLIDQAYHLTADGVVDTTKVEVDMMPEVELYGRPEQTWVQASFGHMVSGYGGAYYGYQWSLVYAQDMFQRFEELGILSEKAGRYYREKVLARGGSMDENEMLRDYLGRAPKQDAFLRHLGIGK